jgi:hypothetical protein
VGDVERGAELVRKRSRIAEDTYMEVLRYQELETNWASGIAAEVVYTDDKEIRMS